MSELKVFKFGGASVRNAEGIRNLAKIVDKFSTKPLVIVISAMGKTTNALEEVLSAWHKNDKEACLAAWRKVQEFHVELVQELFEGQLPTELNEILHDLFNRVKRMLQKETSDYHKDYDRLVSIGELLSTRIVSAYLNHLSIEVEWIDIRRAILTDNRHRQARILWEPTEDRLHSIFNERKIYITQGFIGADRYGHTTTLGREGSDYSAAAIAYGLEAKEVVIWKDVPGILNGDPKVFKDVVLLEQLTYDEAIELAYYGASVIHPRTIQPLKRKNIELSVRSFINPMEKGTRISSETMGDLEIPCFIKKSDQAFISLYTRDLAFMAEDHLSMIYEILHRHMVAANFSVNSAVSSGFCINTDEYILPSLLSELKIHFDLSIERGLSLFTIRNPNADAISSVIEGKKIVISQNTPSTYQVLISEIV